VPVANIHLRDLRAGTAASITHVELYRDKGDSQI
jgi:hypothetical protein